MAHMTTETVAAERGVDYVIGERVHAEMWRTRITQVQLSQALGLDQAAISRRLRGRTAWKVSELLAAARLLGVAVEDLLPGIKSHWTTFPSVQPMALLPTQPFAPGELSPLRTIFRPRVCRTPAREMTICHGTRATRPDRGLPRMDAHPARGLQGMITRGRGTPLGACTHDHRGSALTIDAM